MSSKTESARSATRATSQGQMQLWLRVISTSNSPERRERALVRMPREARTLVAW